MYFGCLKILIYEIAVMILFVVYEAIFDKNVILQFKKFDIVLAYNIQDILITEEQTLY